MAVVAISGLGGSGKTTAARHLAKKFRLRYVCAGSVFREVAKEKGMTLEEFSKYAERNPGIDRMVDRRTADAVRDRRVLIDGRLAGWMAKKADIRILLVAPIKLRARRIARRENGNYRAVYHETVARELSEAKRFKRLYDIDVTDHSGFDLVVNTERLSIRETARILETAVGNAVKRATAR